MHRKKATFGLLPLGMRVEYYCPNKRMTTKLKQDFVNKCPLCGEKRRWGPVDNAGAF